MSMIVETNYEEAHKVNALGPKNLATVCKDLKIPLVHISTDYVFDGKKTEPLKENDNLGPQTAYGKLSWRVNNLFKNT